MTDLVDEKLASSATTMSLEDEPEQLIVVSCYNRFDNLAHGPKGTEAKYGLYTFLLNPNDGQMVLLSVTKDPVENSAFSRFHPTKNILYTCTESVMENGQVVSWEVKPNGQLRQVGSFDAGGTSTCYITLDKEVQNMLVVNYWDATIHVLKMNPESGIVEKAASMYDPKEGKQMLAKATKHVNHSRNDETAQKERQSDPHSHAVILDPFYGRIAYVPDLGMDLIRQFIYDPATSTLTPAGTMPSGPDGRVALGPRYIEFHPTLPVCYVVNELSSEVSVFEFSHKAAKDMVELGPSKAFAAAPTLRLVQTVRTIPKALPGEMNTCGRITVHPAGNFVLVSNRGHDSMAIFKVHHNDMDVPGMLTLANAQHTGGATPRHFAFDQSGQWLIAANQDSDHVSIFSFNLATGHMVWTRNRYYVPSPNFVCSVRPHRQTRRLPPNTMPGSSPQNKNPIAKL